VGQSKRMSFVESLTNVAIGYLVAVGSQVVIFPFFGIHIPLKDNFMIGAWFTVVSIVRSYALRRAFNKRDKITHHIDVDGRCWKEVERA